MSDYIPATISIGGTIKKELLEDLVDCLIINDGTFEYDKESTKEEMLEQFNEMDGFGTVDFVGKPGYGMFEMTEDFCKKHNIDFDRHSDCAYDYEAENFYLRNGKELSFHSLSNEKKDMVLVDDVLQILETGVNKEALVSAAINCLKGTILERPLPLSNIKLA